MHTPATEKFAADLKAAGVAGDPPTNEFYGYMAVDALGPGS